MKLVALSVVVIAAMGGSARADGAYVLADGVNRAPAVTLHCVTGGRVAGPCGTQANPLIVSPGAGATTLSNQVNQVAAEQASAQALGTIGDGAYVGGSGTVVTLLKGLWGVLTGGVPAVPVGGVLVSRSQAVAAAQSVVLFPANATRRYLSFQAPQGTFIWVNPVGGVAAPNAPDCAYFGPGSLYESGAFVNRSSITVYAPVATTISAWEG